MSHRDHSHAPNGGYFAFVKVAEDERSSNFMEIPKEDDGSVLLSTLKGSFPTAAGLRYKSSSGGWRGIRISDNVLDAPHGGWGNRVYCITHQKAEAGKRKIAPSPREERGSKSAKYSEEPKLSKADKELLKDIIVLGLPFKCGDDDLKDYFTKECGELAYSEVKYDRDTKKARGFGFIRFKRVEGAKKAINNKHSIMGRTLEVKLSKKKETPMKLFVGRIPNGTTQDDLNKYFSEFGEISDAYIPTPFRGFGFITFESSEEGRLALRKEHKFKDTRLNVVFAEPKDEKRDNPDRNEKSFSNSERRNDAGAPYKLGSRPMDLRDNRGPRDSTDNRGPRDFRDPVERNQVDSSPRDRNRGEREIREREMRDRNMRDDRNLRDRGDLRETGDIGGIRERDPRDRDVGERIPRASELKERGLNERDSREARLLRDTIREQRELRSQGDDNRNPRDIGIQQRGNPRELPVYRGPMLSRDLSNQPPRVAPNEIKDFRGPMLSRDVSNQQRVDPGGATNYRGSMVSRDLNDQQRGNPREITNYRGPRDSRDLNDQQGRNPREISNYRGTMVSSDRNDQQRGDPRDITNYRGSMVSSDRNTQQRGDPREIKEYRGSMVSSDRNAQQRADPREITNYRGSMVSSDRNTQQRGDPRGIKDHRGSMVSRDRNNDQRIFMNNQSKYDSRHDLQNIKHQQAMQRPPPPGTKDVAAELKNMIYHFLGSSN